MKYRLPDQSDPVAGFSHNAPTSLHNKRLAINTRDTSVAATGGGGGLRQDLRAHRTFLGSASTRSAGGPLRLDQLTAITFTERAAREMRERIRKTCLQRLKAALAEGNRSITDCARSWRPGRRRWISKRSTRFAARCSAPTRWKPGSTRALRCSTPRPRRRRCSMFSIDEQLRDRLAEAVNDGRHQAGGAVRPGRAARDGRPAVGPPAAARLGILAEARRRASSSHRWENFWLDDIALPRSWRKVSGSPETADDPRNAWPQRDAGPRGNGPRVAKCCAAACRCWSRRLTLGSRWRRGHSRGNIVQGAWRKKVMVERGYLRSVFGGCKPPGARNN